MTSQSKILFFGFTFLTLTTVAISLLNKFWWTKKDAPTQIHKSSKQEQKEDWEVYLTNVDDKLSTIVVNLSLHLIAPISDQPNVAWISIKMNSPGPNGLSSPEESRILGQIEGALTSSLKSKANSTYVGRLTSDGHQDLYFYCSDTTGLSNTVSAVMVNFPDYQFHCDAKADKTWDGYLNFLYPLPEQLQNIQNQKVVYNLEKNGDKLNKAREVSHWIYFKNEGDRDSFLSLKYSRRDLKLLQRISIRNIIHFLIAYEFQE